MCVCVCVCVCVVLEGERGGDFVGMAIDGRLMIKTRDEMSDWKGKSAD